MNEAARQGRPSGSLWWLAWFLFGVGVLDVCAAIFALMPASVYAALHEKLGMGTFPLAPVTEYLCRSASALYALHGAIVLYLSFDVVGHLRAIRAFAWGAVGHGAFLLAADLSAGMPLWWIVLEGPSIAGGGVLALALICRSRQPR